MRPVQWTCEGGIGGNADSQAGGSVQGAGSQCAWPPSLARIRTRMQQGEDSQVPSSASSDLEDSSSGPAGSEEPQPVSPIRRLFLESTDAAPAPHVTHKTAEDPEYPSSAPIGPEDLQPVSPISRLFLDPALSTVILMAMEFEGSSMGVQELTGLVRALLSSQPRFTSRIEHRGWWREPVWVPTHVDWPSHVVQEPSLCASCSSTDESQPSILHEGSLPEDPRCSVPRCSVESHVVRLQTLPLFDFNRPLWQVHLLPTCAHIPRPTAVFRIHHVIGDGTSLMWLLSSQSRPSKSLSLPFGQSGPSKSDISLGDSDSGTSPTFDSKEADTSMVIGAAEGNNESALEGDEVESVKGSVVGSETAESSSGTKGGHVGAATAGDGMLRNFSDTSDRSTDGDVDGARSSNGRSWGVDMIRNGSGTSTASTSSDISGTSSTSSTSSSNTTSGVEITTSATDITTSSTSSGSHSPCSSPKTRNEDLKSSAAVAAAAPAMAMVTPGTTQPAALFDSLESGLGSEAAGAECMSAPTATSIGEEKHFTTIPIPAGITAAPGSPDASSPVSPAVPPAEPPAEPRAEPPAVPPAVPPADSMPAVTPAAEKPAITSIAPNSTITATCNPKPQSYLLHHGTLAAWSCIIAAWQRTITVWRCTIATVAHLIEFLLTILFLSDHPCTPVRSAMPFSRLRKQDQRTLPRSFAVTEAIEMERVTRIRKALGATVNDLMMAVIAAGIESYVQHRYHGNHGFHGSHGSTQQHQAGSFDPESTQQHQKPCGWRSSRSGAIRFRAVTMADLRRRTRKGPPVWGNKLGINVISLPISLHLPPLHPPPPLPTAILEHATLASLPRGMTSSTAVLPSVTNSHVIDMPAHSTPPGAEAKTTCGGKEMRRVQRVRVECGQKKVSWEAHLTNLYARLALALLGRKVMAWLFARVSQQTSITVSNIAGPKEKLTLSGHVVSALTITTVGQHQAMTCHIESYAGYLKIVVSALGNYVPDAPNMCFHFMKAFRRLERETLCCTGH